MKSTYLKLKSETAKAICKYYFNTNGEGAYNIFADPEEVEKAIDMAIKRGANTAIGIRDTTIAILQLT